jgi:SulP family sulfate permease
MDPAHLRSLQPKLVAVLQEGLTRQDVVRDVLAGVVVGVVALPLAIAFAIASGVRPEQGIYTAIVAGFLISAFGGCRVQIGGPTGAFVVIVFGIVQQYGYDGLVVATVMAGFMLLVMGLTGMGAVIRYIPYPVTVGFTTGIALIIAVGQLPEALGLSIGRLPGDFMGRVVANASALDTTEATSAILCLATVLIVVFWQRVGTRIPGPLVALLATTTAAHLLHLDAETISSRFGAIPNALPRPSIPTVDMATARLLVSPAIAIALLGGIESLLSAVVADGMTGRRHRSNAELVAQGIANIVSPMFGGIPATGAVARTATNVKNGARTPIAGIVHALTLLVILVFAGPWVGLVPMATLAGILLVVAYNMSEWRHFLAMFRGPRSDVAVLLVTFGLTVIVDLTVAIQVGVVLAALLFMKRMADVTEVRLLTDENGDLPGFEGETHGLDIPPGVEVFQVAGSFFFGAASKFSETMSRLARPPRVVILRMWDVYAMDATGLRALEQVHTVFARQGTVLLLSGVRAQPRMVLEKAGFLARMGQDNVPGAFSDAVARATQLVTAEPEALQ